MIDRIKASPLFVCDFYKKTYLIKIKLIVLCIHSHDSNDEGVAFAHHWRAQRAVLTLIYTGAQRRALIMATAGHGVFSKIS